MLCPVPTRLFTSSACLCLLVFAGVAAAQTAAGKIAVVNIQQAILETDEIRKASADLEAKYKPRQAEMQKIQDELQGIQQKLQAGQGKLTPQQESDLQLLGQRRQRDLQRMSQDLQEEFEAERNDVLTRAGRRMRDVVAKLAEARGYDVVLEANSTLYVRDPIDITKEATAEYNKTAGAGAAPSAAAPPPPATPAPKP